VSAGREEPPSPRASLDARPRRVFLAVSAVVVAAVIVAARQVLLPFVLALVVAYVLLPAVRRVERLRVPRWGAILLVYALTLGLIGGFVSAIVPRLVAEGRGLGAEWPHFTQTARDEWLPAVDKKLAAWSGRSVDGAPRPGADARDVAAPAELAAPDEKPAPFRLVKQPDGSYDVRIADGVVFHERREGVWEVDQVDKTRVLSSAQILRDGFDKGVAYLQENSFELINIGRRVVSAISYGIFTLFMTLMLGGYMMLTHERILGFFRGLWAPASREGFDRFMVRLDRGLSGVVRGQLIICLVNGVLSAVGFSLFGLKYWPILALCAAVMSIIPIFGSILSAVPAVAIGLTQSPATAVGVLAWILGIHQLEANFLNPKIIGDTAKIHPVLVVFSLIVGEHFFQLAGALFAVPCMSIAQTVFLHFRESTMGADPPLPRDVPTLPDARERPAPTPQDAPERPLPAPTPLDAPVRRVPAPTPRDAPVRPLPAPPIPRDTPEPPATTPIAREGRARALPTPRGTPTTTSPAPEPPPAAGDEKPVSTPG
jgi:predicted PurR-regulated permease PerM